MTEMLESVRPLFLAAGWRPGRRSSTAPEVSADHPAASILIEFGGLRVGQIGRGEECATGDVVFQPLPGADTVVRLWCELLQTRLVGVAEVHNAHAEMYVGTDGSWYQVSSVDNETSYAGRSFGAAMERLLFGRRCLPMLRPDQAKVTMYGEVFSAHDSRVYKYR